MTRELTHGWHGDDHYTAPDGREFAIFSEHPRGERRFYWAEQAGRMSVGLRGAWFVPNDARFPDGSTDKRVVQRRVEKYARETGGG